VDYFSADARLARLEFSQQQGAAAFLRWGQDAVHHR
jgi:hypothetical protein